MTRQALPATPFHSRAAAANECNAWITRNGFTLAARYSDAGEEALAARLRVAIADISWRWRITLAGDAASEALHRLFTRDAAALEPGQSLKALWLNDNGAVRGAGLIARYGKHSFLLAATAEDAAWIAAAAAQASATMRDVSAESGGLAVIGPYAAAVLARAGIDPALKPLAFRRVFWRGLDVTLSRWAEHNGYELWCKVEDGPLVWDRIVSAGAPYGILPAGVEAMDLLDVEGGVARPERDYDDARDREAKGPTPRSLGLESLIADDHTGFTGRAGWLANREQEKFTVAGLEIESDEPCTLGQVFADERVVGHVLASRYSSALRRAIALAQIERASAKPGTSAAVILAATRQHPEFRAAPARVAALPFLEAPVLLPP